MNQCIIVISGHLQSCPRAVKFADALASAGWCVDVVGVTSLEFMESGDAQLAASKAWRFRSVRCKPGFTQKLVRTFSRWLIRFGLSGSRLERASEGAAAIALANELAGTSPDLLLVSNLPAYAAASSCPISPRTRLWVDLEDNHVAMLLDSAENRAERRRRRLIVGRIVQSASRIMSASPLMSEDLRILYGRPVDCILNVFDGPESSEPASWSERQSALIWQSQTIGPDRGLEAIIDILGRIQGELRLCLRGVISDDYRAELTSLADRSASTRGRLEFIPFCAPNQLLRATQHYRAGLALECAPDANRQRCLTNKIFEYVAAGVPVVLSDTEAHRALAVEFGDAAVLIDLNSPEVAARALQNWLHADAAEQRKRVLELSEHRFNWRLESARFLECLDPTPAFAKSPSCES